MHLKRTGILIKPNLGRVLLRPFNPASKEQTLNVVARLMALPEEAVAQQLEQVLAGFKARHRNLAQFLLNRFEQVRPYLPAGQGLSEASEARKLLLGAYFTKEYAIEAAALFNPSLVWHPDQSGLPEGSRRFILSLRATGEGHISSITFRTGLIDAANRITLDEPAPFVTTPRTGFHSLAQANYEVVYTSEQHLSERIIFPSSSAEINGIEDARFVQFQEDDGRVTYYATYTAYDGKAIRPQLLETPDFLHFKVHTLTGPAVQNKGMALFPRKINGRYAMISRQDNENIYLMVSDQLHTWQTKELLLKPAYPWEFVQLGNCGSPIETEAGWLVLSHGVGPLRQYALGAFLLDLDDPAQVTGRLREPLLSPNEDEREGYVPNVVYSCGGLIHGRELILPYALSDYASTFATVNLEELLAELTS